MTTGVPRECVSLFFSSSSTARPVYGADFRTPRGSSRVRGVIANVGVHGQKVALYLERLWSKNIRITTRLVDTVTTPMLLKTVRPEKLDPSGLITHRFSKPTHVIFKQTPEATRR